MKTRALMNPMSLVLLLALLLAGCSDDNRETGFAGLAGLGQQQSRPFLQPGPGDRLNFPADFGPHPGYRIEWWYLTANLHTRDGRPLGLQWTQFRQGLMPRDADEPPPPASLWPLQAAWMAHGAVSFNGKHYFEEKLARGDLGQAGASAQPLQVWLDDWQLEEQADGRWRLQVRGDNWSYRLWMTLEGDPVPHGDHGFSAKSASGEGSMYFSLVNIAITGQVQVNGETLEVRGRGWFDREWSSRFLKSGQQGWDWFALHLDSGDKVMVFRLRDQDGTFQSGTWVSAGGGVVALAGEDFRLEPVSTRGAVPVRWRLQIPGYGVDLGIEAPVGDYRNPGLYPYWESPVAVSGSHTGEGYMELTGYQSD